MKEGDKIFCSVHNQLVVPVAATTHQWDTSRRASRRESGVNREARSVTAIALLVGCITANSYFSIAHSKPGVSLYIECDKMSAQV